MHPYQPPQRASNGGVPYLQYIIPNTIDINLTMYMATVLTLAEIQDEVTAVATLN